MKANEWEIKPSKNEKIVLPFSLDCKEGHMKKNRLFVCLQRGQKNIIYIYMTIVDH
jgi:hypothetical protein